MEIWQLYLITTFTNFVEVVGIISILTSIILIVVCAICCEYDGEFLPKIKKIRKWIGGKKIKKIVIVKNKLVNIVVE